MKKKFVLFLHLFFTFFLVKGQYFVSPKGNDLNPGTVDLPFKTIQRAANVMVAGDRCMIMAGIYREKVTPANNGTESNPIVFQNYQNDKVIIIGTDSISGWIPHKNGIFKAYVKDTVLQLSVNKKMANEARYPNFKGDPLSTVGWKPVSIATNGNAIYTGMNFPAGYWVGGYAVALVASKWISENGVIDSSNGSLVHCTKRSSPWSYHTSSVYIGNGVGYITHHLNALDTINEWHWQNDTLYYYPQDPTTIVSSKIEARTRMLGFDGQGKKYIRIEKINFVWATVNFENATGCVLTKGSVWFPTPYFYYDNSWLSSEGKGVAISGIGNKISNCYVANSWGDGISISGKNNEVNNCLVEDCNWSACDFGPITVSGNGHFLTKNTLRKTARSIVINRTCYKCDVTYNDMYDGGFLNDDLGITYSFKTNGGGSQIAYNWVHDNKAKQSGVGIYLDNYDTSYVVHHNVIWNCSYGMITNKSAVNHQIYNNTVWACRNAISTWGLTGSTMLNQIVRNNLSDKSWTVGTTISNNLVSSNPQFTNASANDFTLSPLSPAINKGTQIPGLTDGYIGSSPDIGAYEYGASKWTPGSTTIAPDISEVYTKTNQLFARLPAPLANVATSITESGFAANWLSTIGASGYELEVSSDNFATFVSGYNPKIVTGIYQSVIGLKPSTGYKYRVRALNNLTVSGNSNSIEVTTLSQVLNPPVANTPTAITDSGFTANWNSVTGVTSYQLDVSADNFVTFLNGYNSKTVTGTSQTVTGLNASTAYKYRARAFNNLTVSSNSNSIEVTTVTPMLNPPTAAAPTAITDAGFTANWNSVTGVTNYQLDISTDNFATFLNGFNSKIVAGTSQPVVGLLDATVYKYRVRSVDSQNISINSNIVELITSSFIKQDQTITFTPISTKTLGDPAFLITATSTSGLPVTFATASEKISITNTQVNLIGAGSIRIIASQEGDSKFNKASVSQDFCVNPATPILSISHASANTFILHSNAANGNKWYLNDLEIKGESNNTLQVQTNGIYKVQVKVEDCLSNFSKEVPLIIANNKGYNFSELTISPNPVENYLEIMNLGGDITNLKLIDMLGRTHDILIGWKENVSYADVQHLSQGIYLVSFQVGNEIIKLRFIKK